MQSHCHIPRGAPRPGKSEGGEDSLEADNDDTFRARGRTPPPMLIKLIFRREPYGCKEVEEGWFATFINLFVQPTFFLRSSDTIVIMIDAGVFCLVRHRSPSIANLVIEYNVTIRCSLLLNKNAESVIKSCCTHSVTVVLQRG